MTVQSRQRPVTPALGWVVGLGVMWLPVTWAAFQAGLPLVTAAVFASACYLAAAWLVVV